jgi:hypothetical protein
MSIPDSHLKSIGRLAVNFQFIEAVLTLYVCELISPDQAIGQIVATQLPFARLCTVVRALFEHKYEDTVVRSKLSELLSRAGQLEGKRNQYFHSAWGVDENGSTMRIKMKVSRTGKLSASTPNVAEAELEKVNRDLRECAKALVQLGSEIKLFKTGPR